jgi:uncharacterized protein (TIGR03437 family)
MKYNLFLLLPLCALTAFPDTPYHAIASYPGIAQGVFPQMFVADAAGNYFIVSRATTPSGLSQIHVDKTDSHGSALGSIEFGGSNIGIGLTDYIGGAAVDPQGNLVIAGSTSSPDFPQVSPLITNTQGHSAFVTKIDSQLKNILFSTKLGGTQDQTGAGALAVDNAGNIYVTGSTSETDFPVTSGAYQTQPPSGGASYAFVTEISSNLKAIVFSTYFGATGFSCTESASDCAGQATYTFPNVIALDSSSNVVIAGSTDANDLPVSSGVFGPKCGDCGSQGSAGFLAKFSSDGSKLLSATYVPGVAPSISHGAEVSINALALDGSGNMVAGGYTTKGLPVTAGALQPSFPMSGPYANLAGFVMKLDSAAQHLLFSTYFGAGDGARELATDAQGTIWLTGVSPANALPVPQGTTIFGASYVAALSPDGSTLNTIFTAPLESAGQAIALTANGVTAMGYAGTFLTVASGAGPSLIAVENSGGFSVSNAVAPYEFVSIVGPGIGPQTPAGAKVVNGAIGTSLDGVQVLFDGTPAPLLYVGPTQINAIVPGEVYAKTATTLQIVTPSGTFNGPAISVSATQPGVFTVSDPGSPFGSVLAAALNQDGSVNSASNPAALGSIVTVWASGAGISTREQTDGTIVTASTHGSPIFPVAVFPGGLGAFTINLGGLPAGPLSFEVVYAGDAVGMVACVTQVNFDCPRRHSASALM